MPPGFPVIHITFQTWFKNRINHEYLQLLLTAHTCTGHIRVPRIISPLKILVWMMLYKSWVKGGVRSGSQLARKIDACSPRGELIASLTPSEWFIGLSCRRRGKSVGHRWLLSNPSGSFWRSSRCIRFPMVQIYYDADLWLAGDIQLSFMNQICKDQYCSRASFEISSWWKGCGSTHTP